MMQVCKQCGLEKRMGDFYRHSHYALGRMKTCKVCHCQNVRENYALKAEQYRAYNRARAMLPHHVARRAAYQRTPRGLEVKRRCQRLRMRWIRMMDRQA